MGSTAEPRYTKVAIILHWIIAVCILALLAAGLAMTTEGLLPKYVQFQTFQLHKSLGLTVLVLSIFRLIWRLTHTPPPLPPNVSAIEVFAAKLTHWIFYGLMLALPLTGWAIVSTSPWDLPTIWFGLFEWPHLPGLADSVHKKELNDVFGETHEILAYGAMALIALHAGAALKHHLWNRDNVLTRMLPFLHPLPPKATP
jgi:cytochrome b561